MFTRAIVGVVGLTIGLSSPIMAQQDAKADKPAQPAATPEEKPAPALKVGMPAPEFKVEKFIKGEPFTGFEKGRVYVIEFWATWCGPCIMMMPHLSELQREYKDKGVTICGVNIWEDREYNENTYSKAEKFVQAKGDGMDYTVAYDGAAKVMDQTWMAAAGRRGIPSAFVVDKTGTIAWMGHPMMLDMVLDEVVSGKWDIATGESRLKAAMEAFQNAGEKYKEGKEDGSKSREDAFTEGSKAWEEAMKQYPVMGRTMKVQQFGAMLEGGHSKQACEIGNQILDEAIKAKNAGPIMQIMGSMGDPDLLKTPEAKQLLIKAAKANFDLSDTTQVGPHASLARAYFTAGEIEKGREAAQKALEVAPEEIRPRLETWLKQMEENAAK